MQIFRPETDSKIANMKICKTSARLPVYGRYSAAGPKRVRYRLSSPELLPMALGSDCSGIGTAVVCCKSALRRSDNAIESLLWRRLFAALRGALLLGLVVLPILIATEARALTDEQIKNTLIEESTTSYPGNCPCPYSSARNGSRCGRRSAYHRAGGYSLFCYPEDVTVQMVKAYRARVSRGK